MIALKNNDSVSVTPLAGDFLKEGKSHSRAPPCLSPTSNSISLRVLHKVYTGQI